MTTRADGLTVGEEVWVIQLFSTDGYYSSVVAPTEEHVKEKALLRDAKSVVAYSIPFRGEWSKTNPHMPDVSMPLDMKQHLLKFHFPTNEGDD